MQPLKGGIYLEITGNYWRLLEVKRDY